MYHKHMCHLLPHAGTKRQRRSEGGKARRVTVAPVWGRGPAVVAAVIDRDLVMVLLEENLQLAVPQRVQGGEARHEEQQPADVADALEERAVLRVVVPGGVYSSVYPPSRC